MVESEFEEVFESEELHFVSDKTQIIQTNTIAIFFMKIILILKKRSNIQTFIFLLSENIFVLFIAVVCLAWFL
jgi:hypothetical protein